jgi:hypothetical protein
MEALEQYAAAIRLDPNCAVGYYNMCMREREREREREKRENSCKMIPLRIFVAISLKNLGGLEESVEN